MDEGAGAISSPQAPFEPDVERPPKRLRLDHGQQHAQSPSYLSTNGDNGASGYTSPAPKSLSGRVSVDASADSEVEGQHHQGPTPISHETDEEYRSDEAPTYHDEAARAGAGESPNPLDAGRKRGDSADQTSVEPPKAQTHVRYQQRYILRGHKKGVSAVKFSPDGKWIGSCSGDATIKIWDATTGRHSQTFEGHLAGISTIAWSPDSKTIASGSDDKSIRLWDVVTGKPYPVPLLGHHNYVYSIAFSPKGNMLVSGSYDEAVFLWDVRSGRLMRSLPAHSDPVGGVDFVHDGTLIVSCASDGLIRIWDTATGQCLRTLVHEDNAGVVSVRFSPNGKYVLAWTLDSCVRLWNYVEGRCVKTYQGHRNEKYSMSGTFAVVPISYTGPPPWRRFSHRSQNEYQDHNRNEASYRDRNVDHRHSSSSSPTNMIGAVVVSPSEDGSLVVWDVKSKDILQKTAPVHDGVVLAVDRHPTLPLLVTCGLDRTIRIWRNEKGEADPLRQDMERESGNKGEDERRGNEEQHFKDLQEDEGRMMVNGEEEHDGVQKRNEGEREEDGRFEEEQELAQQLLLDQLMHK